MNVHRAFGIGVIVAAAAALVAGCNLEPRPVERRQLVAGGDADRGKHTFQRYGCTACHTIPGVRGARGKVGPPLTHWSHRRYIAGEEPNRPDLLVQFIKDPQSISPGTAMPNVGVTEADARHMAAYLYRLR